MIKPLTSLRFFFALLVFGSHCYIIDPHFSSSFFLEGFVGVNFFFILSGFIIAYNYQAEIVSHSISKRDFWVARIARIYPLHLLTLLISIFLGIAHLKIDSEWIKHFVANLFLVQSFVPEKDYFFSFNGPAWSLACEQFFYLLFPFLAFFVVKKHRLVGLVAVATVIMLVGMYFTDELNIRAYWYVNPLARFPDFLIGLLLFDIYNKYKGVRWSYSKASFYEVSSIMLFLVFYILASEYIPLVYRYSCYYWIPICLLIVVFSKQSGILSRLLSNKHVMMGGEISFSFYLIHQLVIKFYIKFCKFFQVNIPFEVSIPIILLIIIGLSLLSYTYFEKLTNKRVKSFFRYKRSIAQ